MKRFVSRFALTIFLVAAASLLCFGQGGGVTAAISGVVVDQSGGVIPGAEVTVKHDATSAEAKTITADNGTFSIPALSSGTYTATVNMPGFKQAVVKEIRLLAGVPASVTVRLEVGDINETILVEAGAEIVQSQTANITTTMVTNQIVNLPLNSRNALNFVVNLPGVNTPGTERNSTIMGLPQSFINITIDGISSQDNYNRTSDGFFSRISPRLDAIEEVTVSTATPGAESAGSGGVQIKFITRSGNNEYHGSLYEYLRNTSLNANDWFNNRDLLPPAGVDPATWKAPRTIVKLNQFGGRVGGPIRFPKLFDGRDKAFFFVNMEESRSPSSVTRDRTIFTPQAELGNYLYTVGSETRSVNLFQLAAAKGQLATPDPTIQKLLADIRNSTSQGSLKSQTNPLYETLTFINPSMSKTRFTTTRLDFNLTDKHRVEVTWNYHQYIANKYDLTNSRDPAYPGFPNWGVQGGNRYHGAIALRSSLKPTLVNELRTGMSGGGTLFSPNITAADFSGPVANMEGFALNIYSASSVYNAYRHYAPSRRNPISKTIEDTLTWTKGAHNLSFGFNWTEVSLYIQNQVMVPEIRFGLNSTYDPARILTDSTNGPVNFPGSSSTQRSNAAAMYALLTGRVTQITGTAYLNENTNEYAYNGDRFQRGYMRELGMFVTDSWRVRRDLTINYGLRWGFQYPFVPGNDVYTTAMVEDVWGISGVGNLFKPGTLTGKEPEFIQYKKGTRANNLSYKDFAPSFGFAWSPGVKDGWLGKIVGSGGQSVVRGGYSMAYSRYGMATYANVFNGNPGMFVNATRNVTNGNLVYSGESWPVLLRDKSRLGPPSFQKAPVYPMKGSISDSITIFDPNLRTPYSQSWSFGIQREITKNMVVEVRYVGTRALQGWTEYNLNEVNIVENGFLDEFKLAMVNLQANVAAGRGNTFKYAGPNTGTHPLPIVLAYFSGHPASLAGDTTKYTSTNFTSSTYVNQLAQKNPGPNSFAGSLHGDPTRRANALNAGLPINFFLVNPHLMGGANIAGSGAFTRYDSMVIELRRRMAQGLLVQANYTWAKAFGSSRYSFRNPRVSTYGATLPHALKLNWVYEMPFGRGRTYLSSTKGVLDHILGGWDFNGIARIQSGRLEDFGNVQMVGMTQKELKSVYKLYFDDANRKVYNLPEDIRQNTIKAFNTDPTSPTGYSAAYGVPEGRYFAPANSMGCIQVVTGDCAPHNIFVRGNMNWNFDLSVMKRFRFTEQKNFELRGEFLNAFNNVVFTNASNPGSSQTWGEVTGTVNSPRTVQIVMRINF